MTGDEQIDFPCRVCGTPAKIDRQNGICKTCMKRICASCMRHCSRCGVTYCQNHVEHRTVMIQQVAHQMLLYEACRGIMLL